MSDVFVNSIMASPAELTSLSPLTEWFTQQMASLPVADEWRLVPDLAACETATNITRYALHEDRESRLGVESRVADRRVMLRFIDAGETFLVECLALVRGDEHFDVNPLAGSGRGLRLIPHTADSFDAGMNAGKNITTLIKALPDPSVNYSIDKNGG